VFVIGDDWSTDMLGSEKSGCKGILVKTGKYQVGDETKCNPCMVVNTLEELINT
jgi:ribonucleotide monophosphatase NagD (HAD superfamily)